MRSASRPIRDVQQAAPLGDQHGVDFNGNGEYDFDSAGASDLDEAFPQEATAPANCGTIDDRL
jgi:hypothetical protein